MADNKKYYYMRLKESFFEDDAIKIIESMPDGYLYSNILLKLYLKSLKFDGKLMFNERIPYNSTVLATITHHQIGTVEKALALFKEMDLIEILDNGAIYMLDIQNFIGKANTEADRKRAYRARIKSEKQQLLECGQMSRQCPREIEKDIDIEIEQETEKKETAANIRFAANDDLNLAIISFIDFRKTINKPLTGKGIELLLQELNKLAPNNIISQIDIINQSILNGWQGVFPLKEKQPARKEAVPTWKRKESSLDLNEYDQSTLESYAKKESASDPEFMERKAALEERLKEKYGKGKKEV